MAYVDNLLQSIKYLKTRTEYKNLGMMSKKVVNYLLSEVEESANNDRLPIKRKVSRQYTIQLFNMQFLSYGGLYISTLHKFGAAHITYIKECKAEDIEAVITAIATVCEFLHWEAKIESQKVKSSDRNVEIFAKIPEEANP